MKTMAMRLLPKSPEQLKTKNSKQPEGPVKTTAMSLLQKSLRK